MSSKHLSVGQTLRRADSHARKGEFAQAQQLYQAVLARYPENRKAIEGLKALSASSHPAREEDQYRTRFRTLMDSYSRGRLQEALHNGLTLAAQYPDDPVLHNLLGAIYTGLQRKEEAITSYTKALELDPEYAEAYNNLGIALKDAERYGEAIESFNMALKIDPANVSSMSNLGAVFNQLGRYEQALDCFKSALRLQPENARTHFNLGNAFNRLGLYEQAVAAYRAALKLKPDMVEAHNNLGSALNHSGMFAEAVSSFNTALQFKPNDAGIHYHLGDAFKCLGKHEEAIAAYQRAVELDNRHLSALGDLLLQLAHICDWDRLLASRPGDLASLEFGPSAKEVVLPFSLLALSDDAGFQRRVAEAYGLANYRENPELGPLVRRPAGGRIRIGYFSADFYNHATMWLMAGLFEQHDRTRFEIHAFSYGPETQDEMRTRLRNSVEVFHDVRQHGDAGIAALARSLDIDIAVDLKGYTRYNRHGIFSCRAAPVQVNYLGYPGTLGVPYMDYIIADPVVIPEDCQTFYSEKVVYLPGSYQINDDKRTISSAPLSRAEMGLPDTGFVFYCFNNNYKIMPAEFDIWMRLLDQVDGSVLWLFESNESAQRNLHHEASKRGIDPQRLIFAGRLPLAEHLARQRLADLFVDTFYYNAHTTASDALWAGLPVLTKLGHGFASRVAGSLLTAVGLPELITTTPQAYEETALRLATHPQELKAIKEKLAGNLKTSTLFDTALFARHIEAAYTRMYERLQSGLEPEHIYIEK